MLNKNKWNTWMNRQLLEMETNSVHKPTIKTSHDDIWHWNRHHKEIKYLETVFYFVFHFSTSLCNTLKLLRSQIPIITKSVNGKHPIYSAVVPYQTINQTKCFRLCVFECCSGNIKFHWLYSKILCISRIHEFCHPIQFNRTTDRLLSSVFASFFPFPLVCVCVDLILRILSIIMVEKWVRFCSSFSFFISFSWKGKRLRYSLISLRTCFFFFFLFFIKPYLWNALSQTINPVHRWRIREQGKTFSTFPSNCSLICYDFQSFSSGIWILFEDNTIRREKRLNICSTNSAVKHFSMISMKVINKVFRWNEMKLN